MSTMASLLARRAAPLAVRRPAALLRRLPHRRLSDAPPATRPNDRLPPNQHVLAVIDDAGAPLAVDELWARVGAAQGSWPDGAAVASKTALKRQLNYLKHHNLVRVVPAAGGAPFRYGIVWNKYARRLEAPGDPAAVGN